MAVPWLWQLIASLSPQVPGFDPRLVRLRFMVGLVTLGQVILRLLRFFPVSVIPHIIHTHIHLHVALTRRTIGRILGTFQKPYSYEIGEHWTRTYFHFLSLTRCCSEHKNRGGETWELEEIGERWIEKNYWLFLPLILLKEEKDFVSGFYWYYQKICDFL
jgi:hypothetical protein